MKVLLGLITIVVVYGFLLLVIIGIITRIIRKCKSANQFVKNIRTTKQTIKRQEETVVGHDDPITASFKWTQRTAIQNFIEDRDFGVHFAWISREDNIIRIFNEEGKETICKIAFANNEGQAEIVEMDSFDGSIHYRKEEEDTITKEMGDADYYAAKVAEDIEYINEIQNKLVEQGGDAIYDAKRYNGGNPLPAPALRHIINALSSYDFDIKKPNYETSTLYVTLAIDAFAQD